MHKIKEVKIHIPEDVHADFHWAAKIAGYTMQQAGFCALEQYILAIKTGLAAKEKKNGKQ